MSLATYCEWTNIIILFGTTLHPITRCVSFHDGSIHHGVCLRLIVFDSGWMMVSFNSAQYFICHILWMNQYHYSFWFNFASNNKVCHFWWWHHTALCLFEIDPYWFSMHDFFIQQFTQLPCSYSLNDLNFASTRCVIFHDCSIQHGVCLRLILFDSGCIMLSSISAQNVLAHILLMNQHYFIFGDNFASNNKVCHHPWWQYQTWCLFEISPF